MTTRGRRSRVPGTPSRRQVAIRFTDDEHAAVSRMAERDGLNMADWLRVAAMTYAAEGGDTLPGVVLMKNRMAISSTTNQSVIQDSEQATEAAGARERLGSISPEASRRSVLRSEA